MATWLLEKLIEDNYVDYVICTAPQNNSSELFGFEIIDNINDLKNTSGSVYYPVEMSKIIQTILKKPGRYAITGLPCFIKAIRLACQKNHVLNERITFTIGLVCGQLKSKHYTTYISNLANVEPPLKYVYYRGKVTDKPANDFYYYYYENQDGKTGKIHWNEGISAIWSNRWFTPNACNYCDDVFAELADAVFMDAWLPEYSKDGRGTNLAISRSPTISKLISDGIVGGVLDTEDIPIHKVVKSQAGVIDLKRDRLSYRLYLAKSNGTKIPEKRVPANRNIGLFKKLEVKLQLKMQKESKELSLKDNYDGNTGNIENISNKMKLYLMEIRFLKLRGKLFIPIKYFKKIINRR
jgi:coenzyme F420-reducing hydrogenase beta subunit